MITYRHSGGLGDIIYSLPVIKKLGSGIIQIALNNTQNCSTKYGYGTVPQYHANEISERNYKLLEPLLNNQSYLTRVESWVPGSEDPENLVDLDIFRKYFSTSLNYIECYHRTFNLPCTEDDILLPWLEVAPVKIASKVISRTSRYHTSEPYGSNYYKRLFEEHNLKTEGIFVGTQIEHTNFEKFVDNTITYYPVKDFLALANIISGADLFIGNQTFTYSLAVATNTPSVLEIYGPNLKNECYFDRTNAQYFGHLGWGK